jgi:hypothetical protein
MFLINIRKNKIRKEALGQNNGYPCPDRDIAIYSMWSIIHFLKYKEVKSYWKDSSDIKSL